MRYNINNGKGAIKVVFAFFRFPLYLECTQRRISYESSIGILWLYGI